MKRRQPKPEPEPEPEEVFHEYEAALPSPPEPARVKGAEAGYDFGGDRPSSFLDEVPQNEKKLSDWLQ